MTIGTIITAAQSYAPDGYIECDGSPLLDSGHDELSQLLVGRVAGSSTVLTYYGSAVNILSYRCYIEDGDYTTTVFMRSDNKLNLIRISSSDLVVTNGSVLNTSDGAVRGIARQGNVYALITSNWGRIGDNPSFPAYITYTTSFNGSSSSAESLPGTTMDGYSYSPEAFKFLNGYWVCVGNRRISSGSNDRFTVIHYSSSTIPTASSFSSTTVSTPGTNSYSDIFYNGTEWFMVSTDYISWCKTLNGTWSHKALNMPIHYNADRAVYDSELGTIIMCYSTHIIEISGLNNIGDGESVSYRSVQLPADANNAFIKFKDTYYFWGTLNNNRVVGKSKTPMIIESWVYESSSIDFEGSIDLPIPLKNGLLLPFGGEKHNTYYTNSEYRYSPSLPSATTPGLYNYIRG